MGPVNSYRIIGQTYIIPDISCKQQPIRIALGLHHIILDLSFYSRVMTTWLASALPFGSEPSPRHRSREET